MRSCLACGERFESEGWGCPTCAAEPSRRDGFLCFAPELSEASDGFDPAGFDRLVRYERQNFWFVARSRLLVAVLGRVFPGAQSLMEIGCGTGNVLAAIGAAFPGLRLVGSEISTRGLQLAQRRVPAAELLQMDARRIPFVAEFDVVGAFDVLEHVTEDQLVIEQIRQAVRPGGGVLLTVPQHPRLWSVVDERSSHRRRYRRADLLAQLDRAGLTPDYVTSFVSLLLPVMVASRWRQQRQRARYDPTAEFDLGAWTNRLFGAVSALELRLLRAGTSLPAGGSLLVAARRS